MWEKLVLTSRQAGLWFLKIGLSVINKVPDFNILKQEMRKWLDKKGIPLSRVSSGLVEPDNISTV